MREYTLCSPFRANAHNSSSTIYLFIMIQREAAFMIMYFFAVNNDFLFYPEQ